jgi:hypothetical protein
MPNHKEGDTVRIQTKEWMDAQEKDEDGYIFGGVGTSGYVLNTEMQKYAGEVVVVEWVFNNHYAIEGLQYAWEDWMFAPEDEPLSAKEAIIAMLKGETLYDKYGGTYTFNEEIGRFEGRSAMGGSCVYISEFNYLFVSLNAAEV